MAEGVSIREYARLVGCSDAAVRKAIAAGKITARSILDAGTIRPKIVPHLADEDWGKNHNPNYQRNDNIRHRLAGDPSPAPVAPAPAAPKAKPLSDPAPVAPAQAPSPIPSNGKSLAELKRLKAEVDVQMAALGLKEKRGQLVDKDTVYREFFAFGQEVRQAFQMLPDRVIDEIMASSSRQQAHKLLAEEIDAVLLRLSEMQKTHNA